MSKEIKVRCYGPIAVSKQYESPWEDVWLSWKGKPGRKKYYLGPCLKSRTECKSDLEINLDCQKDYPEHDWSDDIKRNKLALAAIKSGKIFIDDNYPTIPDICSPKEFINRKEAEVMIGVVLKEMYDIKNIKCNWLKPNIIIIPT